MAETIVLRLLAKHFRKYIKDFHEDQFKLSLSKGTAELKNLQLRESSLEDLLLLPSGVGITSAACSNLLVKVGRYMH
jgi:VPS13-like, N-terminal